MSLIEEGPSHYSLLGVCSSVTMAWLKMAKPAEPSHFEPS